MNIFRPELPEEARSTIVQYAFFRWENAIVIAGTILLIALMPQPFPWWPWWGWLLLGLIGVISILFSSITNEEFNARMLLKIFQRQFDLKRIKDPQLHNKLTSALEYQRRIFTKTRFPETSVMKERADGTNNQLNDWIRNMYRLAIRLDTYRRDKLMRQDLDQIVETVDKLKDQRKRETSAPLRKQLEDVIESKEKQLETLQALENRMKQAELSLEQSLTALATVDSQVQLIDAEDIQSGRSIRLREDIQEQVLRLDDLVSSINQVYDYHSRAL
jgi:hypothetical protein